MSSIGKRVLVVEDDPDALATIQEWLEALGCDVRVAWTGRAALQIVGAFQPEVLITDYLLEDDVTGVDIIAQLRAGGIELRCVLVTGRLQRALLEGVNRIDGVPILSKPFDLHRLRELIAEA